MLRRRYACRIGARRAALPVRDHRIGGDDRRAERRRCHRPAYLHHVAFLPGSLLRGVCGPTGHAFFSPCARTRGRVPAPLARFSHLAQSISSKRPGSKKMPARSSRLAQVAEEALPCSGALYSPCVRCQRARAAFRLVFLNLHIARKEKSGYLGWFFSSCAQRRGLGCRSAQPPHAQGEKNPQNWPKMARFSCSRREKRATPRGCGLRPPTPSALRPRWQRPPARR